MRGGQIDVASAADLGVVTYPAQQAVGDTRCSTRAKCDLRRAILSDGNTEIRATFWDREDIDSLVGQVREISSIKSGNGRLAGVSVRANTYEGKTTMELSISKAAIITAEEGVTEAAPVPATALPTTKATPAVIPPSVAAAVTVASKLLPVQKPTYGDIIASYAKCWQDAKNIIGSNNTVEGYLATCQAMAFSLYKSSSDAGLVVGEESRTGGKVPANTEQPF